MEIYVIYKLVRDDGKVYIGTTMKRRYNNRIAQHRCHKRFVGHTFEHEILEESADIGLLDKEDQYIDMYRSFASDGGLNLTRSGRGYPHGSKNFTTRGKVYSEDSRRKMSEKAKARVVWNKGKPGCFSDATRDKMSRTRTGRFWGRRKITASQEQEIIDLYLSRPQIEGVGERSRNGRDMSYHRAFGLKYGPIYKVVPQNITSLLRRRGLI